MRYCNFCRKETETKDEDCVICGFSKPHDGEHMFKSVNNSWHKAWNKFDKSMEELDKTLENIGDAVGDIAGGSSIFQSSNMSKMVTEDMAIKVEGKKVTINGDIKSVSINGVEVYPTKP